MDRKQKRQIIIDYIVSNEGLVPTKDYKKMGFLYSQDFCNNRNSLIREGYISKIGYGKYKVFKQKYELSKIDNSYREQELKRLYAIEKKYKSICKICNINPSN